ncbi:dihydroxyacetone kinase subunit DhaL [Virgibacillus oceani]
MELTVKDLVQWFEIVNEKIQANKDYLTSLDQPIGDGDHGINMARGFQETVNKITSQDYEDVSAVFKDIAMTVMAKVGGAAGPLYGTAFLKFSMAVKGSRSVNYEQFTRGLEAAVVGVKQRGKSAAGEKTIVDVWQPVTEHFKDERGFRSVQLFEVAKQAVEDTKEMMATKGRASYFKEKSIGHIDPGAFSSFLIFDALDQVLKGDA